jgi:glycogen debranching enzyme
MYERICSPERRWIWLSDDGLVENGAEGTALTWMDARAGSAVFTPRHGLAVELQALWSKACDTLALLARAANDQEFARAAEAGRESVRTAFRARFWCPQTGYPFDCMSADGGTADAWVDPSIRPNALLALAVDPDLFDADQALAIVERVEKDLLTLRGIRSLAPADAKYIGHSTGAPEERLSAYHQGTAWPYLLGFFVRASLRARGDDPAHRRALHELVEAALSAEWPTLGHVSQIADGDPPHRPRGVPAQAFSTSELLRALVVDLGVLTEHDVSEECRAPG